MKNTIPPYIIILIILLILCCCLIIILGGVLVGVSGLQDYLQLDNPFFVVDDITPTPFELTRQPISTEITSTLEALEQTIAPERDLIALACRFDHICDLPLTLDPPAVPYFVGSKRQFWVNNSDSGLYAQITATLEYLTTHVYFWVEEGVPFNQQEAEDLINTFEEQIYPTNRAFFGSEWTPGVDNDPHIYIIYAKNLGAYVAGFFISLDEYNPLIVDYSNGIEAFYIDSSQDLGNEYTYSTLAHEFQHMIHWYQDSNESSFLDEGFSELASFLNGFDTGGMDWIYTSDPDIALTDWRDSGENSAHYGANFLFVTYFLDRFGDQATQALVHDQLNELESVDNTLEQLAIYDPLTGMPITADDFFLDWVIANYLNDKTVGDGRYYYHNYPSVPTADDTEWISSCPQSGFTRTVNQYGVDYLQITCTGEHIIHFSGTTQSPLLPINPHSGDYVYWSNKANESNTSLSRKFDLTNVTGPITLQYWTWFNLESNYDYVYLEVSMDEETWEILVTPSGTGNDLLGNAYGWGYTGQSDGWVQETIDLSQYAGQNVTIHFDYITDAVLVNEGFILDDISIPEIDYWEDFETDDGGWKADGFVRVQNILPQTYRLALIKHTNNGDFVELIPVNPDQTADILISLDHGEDVILVVTATTRFTMEEAPYQISIP